MHPDMQIEQDNGVLTVKRPSDDKAHRALHGLTRSLIHNMVVGVTTGFEKKLEIVGTGYRAQLQGKNLVLNMGYSHPVEFQPIEGITFEVPTPNKISVKGIDKQVVGQIAANIREVRPPEPARKAKPVRNKRGRRAERCILRSIRMRCVKLVTIVCVFTSTARLSVPA